MSTYFKVSGKKNKLPQSSKSTWELTPRPGGWLVAELFEEKQGKKVSVARKRIMVSAVQKHLSAHLGTSTWFGEIVQESLGGGGLRKGSESDLMAQFPGKIRKIHVHENQTVQEGDVLLLVEAMKMEFAIRAPSAGKVLRMRVSEGEQIAPGTQFLDWESLENEK